jgi:hypothetical protein
MGYNQVSPIICSKPARPSQQILHDRHMEFICCLGAQEAKWSNQYYELTSLCTNFDATCIGMWNAQNIRVLVPFGCTNFG